MPHFEDRKVGRLRRIFLAGIDLLLIAAVLFLGVRWYYVLRTPPVGPRLGQSVSLRVDWTKKPKTLVLVLQKGCHYCSASAGFYQRLRSIERSSNRFWLVAALPQEPADSATYLRQLAIEVDDIQSSALDSLDVRGTPTVLLVNHFGKIAKVWVGQLKPSQEQEVIQSLAE